MDNMVKIRMTKEFMEQVTTRDDEGNKLAIMWGEADEEGFYVPIIVVNSNDNIVKDAKEKIEKLQEVRRAAIEYRKCHWIYRTRIELDEALREIIDG